MGRNLQTGSRQGKRIAAPQHRIGFLGPGTVFPVQDQPHVWEHTLFYLAAVRIEGAAPYSFAGSGRYVRACAAGNAPAAAC
jgi:hypothetical protein